jgi:hypothetical protein
VAAIWNVAFLRRHARSPLKEGTMDERTFDSLTRRAAEAVDRRALLGLLGAAALSTTDSSAAWAGGGKGHKKKKKKKGCPHKDARDECSDRWHNYCSIQYDGEQYNSCFAAYHHCCGLYCSDLDAVLPCIDAVPW